MNHIISTIKVDNSNIKLTGLTLKNDEDKNRKNGGVVSKKEAKKEVSLCHRCEYRAKHKEEGHAPRFECGNDGSLHTCYNYKPVRPVSLKYATYYDHYDKINRSLLPNGGLAGARMSAEKIAEGEYQIVEEDGVFTTFFVPK